MDGEWLARLKKAIEVDGRSMRAISLAAGLGANYLSEVIRNGKEPGVEKMMRICEAMNVSFTSIVTGVELDADAESYLRMLANLSPSERRSLDDLARALQKSPQR